jgi:hypothetical protein
MTSSATGGYLRTTSSNTFATLYQHLHDFLVGVSGLSNTLVRPAFQKDQPIAPSVNTTWLAFDQNTVISSGYLDLQQNTNNATAYMTCLTSVRLVCYGPTSMDLAFNLKMNLMINQNWEQLNSSGFYLVGSGDIVRAAELVGDQWLDRHDLTFDLRFRLPKNYDIKTLLGADINLNNEFYNELIEVRNNG